MMNTEEKSRERELRDVWFRLIALLKRGKIHNKDEGYIYSASPCVLIYRSIITMIVPK